jgi:hypothetical protein
LLRWCIEQDVVAVTTSSKEQRLSDYLRAMTFKLTPAEVKMVSCLVLVLICPGVDSTDIWLSSLLQINEAGSEKHFRAFWTHKFAEDDRR